MRRLKVDVLLLGLSPPVRGTSSRGWRRAPGGCRLPRSSIFLAFPLYLDDTWLLQQQIFHFGSTLVLEVFNRN
jgi:hypothetical protein